MKSKTVWWVVSLSLVLLLGMSTCAMAQDPNPAPNHFRGVISDYTPATGITPTGPWEMRGTWSLKLNNDRTEGDFSAALVMELSDYSQNPSNVNTAGGRMQHTHHITMRGGTVTLLSSGGFEVTGPVTIDKSGGPVPFGPSVATITITGGSVVEFSNMTLTYQTGSGAIVHFGAQAINGVVRSATHSDHDR
jgi:hypothetical protein